MDLNPAAVSHAARAPRDRSTGRPAPCVAGRLSRGNYSRSDVGAELELSLETEPEHRAAAMRAADQDPGPPAAGRQLGRTAGRLRRPQRQRRCISRPGSETFRGPGTSFRPRNGRKGADGEQSAAGGRGSACLAIVGRFPLSAVSRRNLKRRRAPPGCRPVTADSVDTRRLLADRDGICFCISNFPPFLKKIHTL